MKKIKAFFWVMLILLIPKVSSLYASELSGEGQVSYGLGQVSYEAATVLDNVAKLIMYVAIIAGIAFILTSLLKLKQHWKNPQQIPISQVISLFILGLLLVGIPLLINYTQDSTVFSKSFFYDTNNELQLALN